ncbi:MAG TPA: DUF6351 family protein [Actinomycetota bacterium]|nr:DUF6351 family protein [Actinomycetota bacterium]
MQRFRVVRVRARALIAALAVIATLVQPTPGVAAAPKIVGLSTRLDMATGGDILVGLDLPGEQIISAILDNTISVADRFQPLADGRPAALLEGLTLGTHKLQVSSTSGMATATIKMFSATGPVFSGAQQQPFLCETESAGLGAPLDQYCSAPTRVEHHYKSVVGAFRPLPAGPYPPDMTTTTTTDGKTVPYVVRVESGTLNRAIYRTAILDDPAARAPQDAYRTSEGWNQRLVYAFGGGCGPGYHQGVNSVNDVLNDGMLSKGYAVATSTLNVLQINCNDVVSAETAMMVKERFIERHGVPLLTVGTGASGGAIQQHMIATAYPGILDGIMPAATFPDTPTTGVGVFDCRLLNRAFDADRGRWTEAKRKAVTGFATANVCRSWDVTFAKVVDPRTGCDAVVPREWIYDPVANPKGARCTIEDGAWKNIVGVTPATGFARRPYDNVGVQYGLAALNAGEITPEDFIALNQNAGGYDVDGNLVAKRSVGDATAIRRLYETGRVVTGAAGLAATPIIDVNLYATEYAPVLDIHDRVRPFLTRARLNKLNAGDSRNHVMWTSGASLDDPLPVMDRWVTAFKADTSTDPIRERVARAKPAEAADKCVPAAGQEIREPASYTGSGTCNTLFPAHGTPRMVAGESLANDVLKCALRGIDWTEYRVSFTLEQKAQLERIFPTGVCNWAVNGSNQVAITNTWLSF